MYSTYFKTGVLQVPGCCSHLVLKERKYSNYTKYHILRIEFETMTHENLFMICKRIESKKITFYCQQ